MLTNTIKLFLHFALLPSLTSDPPCYIYIFTTLQLHSQNSESIKCNQGVKGQDENKWKYIKHDILLKWLCDQLNIKAEFKGDRIYVQLQSRPGHVKPFDKLAAGFDAPLHCNAADVWRSDSSLNHYPALFLCKPKTREAADKLQS